MPLRLSVFSVKTGPLITYHKGKTFFYRKIRQERLIYKLFLYICGM